jgi:hypothetical protein
VKRCSVKLKRRTLFTVCFVTVICFIYNKYFRKPLIHKHYYKHVLHNYLIKSYTGDTSVRVVLTWVLLQFLICKCQRDVVSSISDILSQVSSLKSNRVTAL